jgi:hypothetical protein
MMPPLMLSEPENVCPFCKLNVRVLTYPAGTVVVSTSEAKAKLPNTNIRIAVIAKNDKVNLLFKQPPSTWSFIIENLVFKFFAH